MDAAFLQTQIDDTKAMITAYTAAITAIVTGGVQKYSLDTGQDKTDVTKLDLPKLREARSALYNELCILQTRLDGSASFIGSPDF